MAENDIDYLTRTATPAGTMTRQGVRQSIERLHPAFRAAAAATVRAARAAGMTNAGIHSAYRAPSWGVGGFRNKKKSLHAYGAAVDFTGIGRPGSQTAKDFYDIATQNGIYNPYGPSNRAEWNHFQLVPTKAAPAEWQAAITGRPPNGEEDLQAIWSATGIPFDGTAIASPGRPTPPADVSTMGSTTLKQGSKGERVAALQHVLAKAGYYTGKIDGDYGPGTKAAVRAVQVAENKVRAAAGIPPIKVDGIVGNETRPLLVAWGKQQAGPEAVAQADLSLGQAKEPPGAKGTLTPFDMAQRTPDTPASPLGATAARQVPDRSVGPLAAAVGQTRQPSVGGVPIRDPTTSELEFFRSRPEVGGYAAPDNKVVLNPFSRLTEAQKNQVALNEAARVQMRIMGTDPNFSLTPEQQAAFGEYGSPLDQRQTVAARVLAGDPSALNATPEQKAFAGQLAPKMGLGPLAPAQSPPRGNLAMTAPQPGIGGPTPEQFEAAKQQIRDVQGPIQINPYDIGVDPRDLPVEAGTGGGVFGRPSAITEAAARQNAIQNLRGGLLAGSLRPQAPQIAFGGATGRGPATMAPQSPPSPRANPELATVEQMRDSFRRMPLPRGGSVPLGIGAAAEKMSDAPRRVPTTSIPASRVPLTTPSERPRSPYVAPRAAPVAASATPSRAVPMPLQSTKVGYAPGFQPTQAQAFATRDAEDFAGLSTYKPTNPLGAAATPDIRPPPPGMFTPAPQQQPGIMSQLGMVMQNPLMRAGVGFLTGGPLGALAGGVGGLLGMAIRNNGGLGGMFGGDPSVAAMNRAVAGNVRQSDLIGGNAGSASYGRKQSDGSVTGRTSTGTGYTSNPSRGEVSVGGKTYRENKNGRGYSRVF